jgi:hypothetical protein
MRRSVLAVIFALVPSVVAASPCIPDSLAGYIGLGSSGCEVGLFTVSNFSNTTFDPTATPIPDASISVTPVVFPTGFRLDFGPALAASAGEFFDALIGYHVISPLSPILASLGMTGASATPDGVVTAVEDICANGAFGPDPTVCSGTQTPPLIVFQDGFGNAELTASLLFGPASFFDVFTEIGIDAGPSGTASLTGAVSNQFTAIPEPSSLVLLGGGMLLLVRRRVQSSRRARP